MMPSDSIKPLAVLAASLWIGLAVAPSGQLLSEPFFPVGVIYRFDPASEPQQVLRELQDIRAQGFNVIQIPDPWPAAEPTPARPSADRFATLVDLAARADLKVITPRDEPADRLFASRRPVLANSSLAGPRLRLWAWAAMSLGARALIFAEPSESAAAFARVVTRNSALFDPLRPRSSTTDVRIDGGEGAIKVAFLESPDVIMVIGLNHSDRTHRVTMTFPPDTQEAIWQNMETGTSVNFVAGPTGPTYTYRFAPHDVFVLMIRRAIK